MEFSRRESCWKVVEAASSLCSKKKSGISSSRQKDEFCRLNSSGNRNAFIKLRCGEIGPVGKHGKKAVTFFHEPEKEDGKDDKQFQFESEIWSNEEDCMWLSSSCSPSFRFSDYRSSGSWDLSVEDLLVSWLSMSGNSSLPFGKGISFFDGSGVNPLEEAHLVLDTNLIGLERVWQEDLEEEEVVMWLQDSVGDHPNGTELSSEQSFCENISGFNGEDLKFLPGRESEIDESDFPSPSYKTIWSCEIQSSNSSSLLTEKKYDKLLYDFPPEHLSDASNLEDLDTDGPLFWPFECKLDWSAEVMWDCFCISPHKNNEQTETSYRLYAPKSIRLRLHGIKSDVNDGCKRRLVFSPRTTASTPRGKDITTEVSIRKVPLEMKDKMDQPNPRYVPVKAPVRDFKFLEESFTSKEASIEMLLGLNEFDGHEGIDAEFDQDHFTLDESLYENTTAL